VHRGAGGPLALPRAGRAPAPHSWEVLVDRGVYRSIYSAIVDDPDFIALSVPAKVVFYTCRVGLHAGPAAIFRYHPAMIALHTGLDLGAVSVALAELDTQPNTSTPWIIRDSLVLWIRNGLRHDPTMHLSDEKHRKSIARWLAGLPKSDVVAKFCDYYTFPRPSEGQPRAIGELPLLHPVPASVPVSERGSGGKPTRRRLAATGDTNSHLAPRWTTGLTPAECRTMREATGQEFVSETILDAVRKSARLGQDATLHEAPWWHAAFRAYPAVQDYPDEIARAEHWLMTKGRGHKDMAAFMRNWLTKAERDAHQEERADG